MAAIDPAAGAYAALTAGCALLDRSERGKLALAGPEAKEFLTGQVTNDIAGLQAGRGCQAALLTHKGKMLADVRVLDAGGELLLDTDRQSLQELFNRIHRGLIGFDARLDKRTLQRGLLSLIGPQARAVAEAGAAGLGTGEHDNAPAEIGGAPVHLVATDTGVDVLCDADDTSAVAAALAERGAVAVSDADAEIVRVERGRPRYGVDLDDTVIPQEAGLNERAVSFTKGCYVGQETVARLHYKGKPNRHLRGLRLSAAVPAGAALRLGDREVGTLTSSVVSPALGPIGLALVRREAAPGDTVLAGNGGVTAEVVALPF
jgi:tRNA-modifying protein YgfZ